MSWRTSRILLFARNIGRALGLNRLLGAALNSDGGYEAVYDELLSKTLRQGDVVWDVGANVGYYTKLFAARIGISGTVHAFEPSAANFKRLRLACDHLSQVHLHQFGLGSEDGALYFLQGTDDLGATSRVVDRVSASNIGPLATVDIRMGEKLIQGNIVEAPNVIKIDTEGFELEVLLGLGNELRNPMLHTIGVEVHFGQLRKRGMGGVPRQIEKILKKSGFRVEWPDYSHLLAHRSGK